ncbi:MAG TPA: hypothetical protein VII70_03575 [Steroidobacteraceae bacterium]
MDLEPTPVRIEEYRRPIAGKYLYRAVLWSSTSAAAPQDLNKLMSAAVAKEFVLTGATGINDNCTIVANGHTRADMVNNVAFLLKPLDPSSCVTGL